MCLPYIVEITFECVCRREDEDHADHPRHGFARADRRIAQHRHELKAENRLADQLHRAANQQRGGEGERRREQPPYAVNRQRDPLPLHDAAAAVRAEMAADGEGKAAVQPKRQRGDQAVQRGGRADLRKRRVAEQVARDGGICEVVDLLKQIADKERQGRSEASGFL